MKEYKNVFYFYNINSIGGVETFLYYLISKYEDNDITILYKHGDINQIKRLRELARVKKYKDEKIKCEKVFFSYEPDIIDNIEAKEYIGIAHANFKAQGVMPPLHPKITKWYGVSKDVCKSFEEQTGIKCELAYNPIYFKTPKRPLKLISATRLTAEKGKARMERLGMLLDQAGIPYIWLVFTNSIKAINNNNIIFVPPKLDILKYIQEADFLVQLSDSEAFCYSVVESLMLNVPVIVTDLPVYKEIGLNDSNSIRLDLNFNEIPIEKLTKKYKFTYEPPKDTWGDMLAKGKNTYRDEPKVYYEVEALDTYQKLQLFDFELNEIPKKGDKWLVIEDRLDTLLGDNNYKLPFVKVNREITDIKAWEKEENYDS